MLPLLCSLDLLRTGWVRVLGVDQRCFPKNGSILSSLMEGLETDPTTPSLSSGTRSPPTKAQILIECRRWNLLEHKSLFSPGQALYGLSLVLSSGLSVSLSGTPGCQGTARVLLAPPNPSSVLMTHKGAISTPLQTLSNPPGPTSEVPEKTSPP